MDEERREFCSCVTAREQALHQARAAEVPVSELLELADFFKLFADPTRLRILGALDVSEFCVCHLAEALDMTSSAISHQLAALRRARLVRSRKEGKTVYYALDDDHVREILQVARIHREERRG